MVVDFFTGQAEFVVCGERLLIVLFGGVKLFRCDGRHCQLG